MDVKSLLCSIDSSIKETMVCIDKSTKGLVFIVDEHGKLKGVITDGDIRRLLIAGHGLQEPIKEYLRKSFIYSHYMESPENIFSKLTADIQIMPLVNDEMQVVDYMEYNQQWYIPLAKPQLTGNEYKYLIDAFLSTWISSTGKYIPLFEELFSRFCGVKYGVATSNGTTALHLALEALNVGVGDEIIVPDLTFAATINAVLHTGATPVIVDIEEDSWCISPDAIENAITDKTKAIIPVHLYGQPCDMGRICDIAAKKHLFIVEDCAEAHGAEWGGKKVGSFGDISCFSFFGNKVVTTGEGGMCVTNDFRLDNKLRILRDHGMSKERKYYHEYVGYNYRMTNLQAAIGVAQVERIDEILSCREKLEALYRQRLISVEGLTLQKVDLEQRKKITWLISILVSENKRDSIMDNIKNNGIDVRPFFVPLSEMKIYKQYARECTNSKKISKMGINLPTNSSINEEIIREIAEVINSSV